MRHLVVMHGVVGCGRRWLLKVLLPVLLWRWEAMLLLLMLLMRLLMLMLLHVEGVVGVLWVLLLEELVVCTRRAVWAGVARARGT